MKVTLSLPEWGIRVAQGNQGKYDFAINGGAGAFGDPDDLTTVLGTGTPSYRRSFGPVPEGIDDLLAKARHEVDVGSSFYMMKRRTAYADLSRLCAKEVPICPLGYRKQAYAMKKSVKSFKALPGFLFIFSGTALDTATVS